MVWVTSTHEPWGLSLIKVLQKQLIDISKLADFECRNINLAGEEHIHATFELLNVTLQTLEEK
ncbi:hypothetical protein HMI55_002092 [Coelomomyces lativittatus]|nr:hypothetical protein HMI55_002092 [Coelomomyces lativittatus]